MSTISCHDLLMMSINLSSIVILNLTGVDYRCIVNKIWKCKTVHVLENADLSLKKWNIIKYKFSLSCIKDG